MSTHLDRIPGRVQPTVDLGLASHGWTAEQAAVFAGYCRAHGFTDATTSTHGSGRGPTVSVTAP